MAAEITGIIGKKLGMTRMFTTDRKVQPLTALEAGPCVITQVKTAKSDGYNAVQLGFGTAKKLSSSQKGHLKELGMFKYLREFRQNTTEGVKRGDKVDVSQFKPGDHVDITGVTRGKGFAGVVKRHHFAGGFKTHGQSDRHRAPGAIGASTHPGHVMKGLRMAGHMGDETLTVRNLLVVGADAARNLLLVKGAVPGGRSGLLLIRKSIGGK
jgi:large subunit ribosomal protein L3